MFGIDGLFHRFGLQRQGVYRVFLTAILIKKTGRTRMQGSPDYPRQYESDRLFTGFGLQAGNLHVHVPRFV